MIVIASAASLLLQAGDDAALRNDVHCVLAAAYQMSREVSEPRRSQYAVLAYYFAGRIDGRGQGDKLEAVLVAERSQSRDEDLAAMVPTCVDEGRVAPRRLARAADLIGQVQAQARQR